MDTHTFPIEEQEKRKLEEVQKELQAQPAIRRAEDYLRSNRSLLWATCAAAGFAGYMVGKSLVR